MLTTSTNQKGGSKVSEQPWVAICTPTRGMVFTEVIEYVEAVRSTYPNISHFLTHDQPIPDCFNMLAERVLADPKYQYILWVEEDTIPPDRALDHLLEAVSMYDVAAIDYGFNGGWNTIVRSSINDQILFTGFGCTMMKRSVLEAFNKPIFKANKAFNISNLSWYDVDPSKVYGMYDIMFASEAKKYGKTFYQVPGECRHLQLVQTGTKEVNNGLHVITEKDRISRPLKLPINEI